MNDAEQREAARQFVNRWVGKGKEDEDGRSYWIDLLSNVLGMENVIERLNFEKKVVIAGHTKRIDIYIPETRVIIEQKSLGKGLDQKTRNSGEVDLTPFEQADRYNSKLTFDERARWIVTCNFSEIWIYDMNQKEPEPVKIELEELQNKYPLLEFLVQKEVQQISHEVEVSIKAGDIVGLLYEAFLKQYRIPELKEESEEQKKKREHKLKSLNALCVRIVFCLYAEDAGIFGKKRNIFHDYLSAYEVKECRRALIELFKTLDTPIQDRDEYLEEDLAQFPYVNGGLFADESIEIPQFTEEIKTLLLTKASENFNWRDISPTIFGAVFESTLNPETRRSGGMHYTSIENIHKVIDPLFLDELKEEFSIIKEIRVRKTKEKRLDEFQDKLASLIFLDPACGSGNFLTETYLSLRRLENEVIKEKVDGQMTLGEVKNPIKVSIQQFYGIEINDFAVTVGKTALWIAESQMLEETKSIVYGFKDDFLPLKTYVNITKGNALQLDWKEVVLSKKISYIMGNPPFIGASMMSQEQKKDVANLYGKVKRANSIDYVGAWYYKAAELVQNTNIEVAFVSTNSITQGEQVEPLWNRLLKEYNVHIIFAWRTFKWNSEAKEKAAVHCVIIGFCGNNLAKQKRLYYTKDDIHYVQNINPYLIDAPDILISSRGNPLCSVKKMTAGNKPTDGGNLILSQEERDELLKKYPDLQVCIKRYIGARDYINNNEKRYCLWLKDVSPEIYRKKPEIIKRLERVRKMRMESSAKPTRELADRPYLFFSSTQGDGDYLCIPEVSSQRRRYIPIGFMGKDVIASNKLLIVPGATLFDFGVLTSNIHMAWMRVVCGRLKSDYQYSGATVYNTFPWPKASEEQKKKIEKTANEILNARSLYPESSLADLYDPLTMPAELRRAHTANDKAVMAAYGFDLKMTEADCVAALFKMYQELLESRAKK